MTSATPPPVHAAERPAAPTARPVKGLPEYTPNFVKLAESYGAYGMRVEKEEDMARAFQFAKGNTDAPTILEFIIDSDELVLPMVQGGKPLHNMILDC